MKHRTIFPVLLRCRLQIGLEIGLLIGLLSGCGAARPSKFYQLSVPGDAAPTANPSPYPVTLLLGPITSSHLYRDDHIVYTSTGQAMGGYEYQRWAEPPAEMIGDVLLRELRLSGRYQHVYSLHSDLRGDYLLRGSLYDLREIDGSALLTRVAFEFELRDSKTRTVVWSHSYSHDEPVNGKDVTAVVATLDHNVQSGLSEIADSLNQYFSTHAAVGPAAH